MTNEDDDDDNGRSSKEELTHWGGIDLGVNILMDADGNTDIYDKNGKLELSVSPKKYRILFFTSRLHGVNLPVKSKRRVIAVFTFI